MKKLLFISILILPLSSAFSDEIGPHRKAHKIGKNTIVLEKMNPPRSSENRKRVPLPVTRGNRKEDKVRKLGEIQKHEYLGIKVVTYSDGLSRVEWWPLGEGRENSSFAVSNIKWSDLEGVTKLDLNGIRYSFILFQTIGTKEEMANRPSGIKPLSEGDALFKVKKGAPEALVFMKSLHDYVTEKKEDLAVASAERSNLLKIKAATEKAEKAKPKTTVIRYWTKKKK